MKPSIWMLLGFLALAGSARAALVTVTNHSFESPALSPGAWSNLVPDGWTDTQGDTNHNFVEYIAGFSAEGAQHLGYDPNPDPQEGGFSLVYQDLAVGWDADTVYTLTIGVGNRNGQPTGIARMSLASSLTAPETYESTMTIDTATIPGQTFQDTVLQFTTGPVAPPGDVRIVLSNDPGGRVHFDNVRLDVTPIPEPAALAVAGILGLGIMRARRRSR
jgi:hypothetical protein